MSSQPSPSTTSPSTPSATPQTPDSSIKHPLTVFIPVAIASSFAIVVIAAFIWWMLARLDGRPNLGSISSRQTEEGLKEHNDEPLPKYEPRDTVELPPYEASNGTSNGTSNTNERDNDTPNAATNQVPIHTTQQTGQ